MQLSCASYNIMYSDGEIHLSKTCYSKFEVRLPKVLTKIEDFILQHAIIALQEVDPRFLPEVLKLLETYQYHGVYTSYGAHGILIAYPKTFVILEHVSIRVGTEIRPTDLQLRTCKLARKNQTCFKHAMLRKNVLLLMLLRHVATDEEILVASYHMPVFFYSLATAGITISKVVETIEKHAGTRPYIFLTDLNVTPNTAIYRYITTGTATEAMYPTIHWEPYKCKAMIDARSESDTPVNSPTVRSRDRSGRIFEGCIDYCFVSPHFTVTGFHQKAIASVIPSESEGSDHIPIIASLSL